MLIRIFTMAVACVLASTQVEAQPKWLENESNKNDVAVLDSSDANYPVKRRTCSTCIQRQKQRQRPIANGKKVSAPGRDIAAKKRAQRRIPTVARSAALHGAGLHGKKGVRAFGKHFKKHIAKRAIFVDANTQVASDAQTGRKNTPFATLQAAFDKAMKREGRGLVTVFVKSGSYDPVQIDGKKSVRLIALDDVTLPSISWMPTAVEASGKKPGKMPMLSLTSHRNKLVVSEISVANDINTRVRLAIHGAQVGSVAVHENALLVFSRTTVEDVVSAKGAKLAYARKSTFKAPVHVAQYGTIKQCQFATAIDQNIVKTV